MSDTPIKARRQALGLSVDDMCARLGVNKSRWLNIELGLRLPKEEEAQTITAALGLNVDVCRAPSRQVLPRVATLTVYGPHWAQPTGEEVRALLVAAELTAGEAARLVGVKDARTVRKWLSFDADHVEVCKRQGQPHSMSAIPYAAWALLADAAGHGQIWKGAA